MRNLFVDSFMKEEALILKEMLTVKNNKDIKEIITDLNSPGGSMDNAHFEGGIKALEKEPNEDIFSIPSDGKFIVFHNFISSITYANGNTYEGSWIDGEVHGKGKYNDPNNFVYDGHWRKGLFDGWGEIKYYADGKQYKGQFKKEKWHGLGTVKLESEILRGYFENNLLVEKITNYELTDEDEYFTYT